MANFSAQAKVCYSMILPTGTDEKDALAATLVEEKTAFNNAHAALDTFSLNEQQAKIKEMGEAVITCFDHVEKYGKTLKTYENTMPKDNAALKSKLRSKAPKRAERGGGYRSRLMLRSGHALRLLTLPWEWLARS